MKRTCILNNVLAEAHSPSPSPLGNTGTTELPIVPYIILFIKYKLYQLEVSNYIIVPLLLHSIELLTEMYHYCYTK